MTPRVLLLMSTSSYKAQAFLEAAAVLGISAVVGSDREQVFERANPGGLLRLDFVDVEAATRTAREFNARFPLRAVLACDDDGLRAAAAIRAAVGLAGSPLAAVERARDKRLMRAALAEAGVRSPWFEVWPAAANAASIAARLRYPCVLKPPVLSASRGVLRADNPPEFVAAFARVVHVIEDAALEPADREVLVEEYLPGDEIAVEGLLSGGVLRVLAVFDKPDPLEGPTFEETIYVTPSRHPAERLADARQLVAAMAAALGLTEGPVHAEVRLNGEGCWPLEIAPRSIGGLCSRALRFGAGHSLEELLLRHAVGEDVEDWLREPAARAVMMIPVPKPGILHGVSGIEEALEVPGVDEVRIAIPVGHPVLPPPEGNRYLGFLFAHGASPADAESAVRQGHNRLNFQIHTE